MIMGYELDKLISKEDESYEESISKDPHDSLTWLSYYKFKVNSLFDTKLCILYRAVHAAPKSKELWGYLIELVLEASAHPDSVIKVFEKSLVHLPKDKSIWMQYLQYLLEQQPHSITKIRRTFNECLRNLPIADHKDIWPMYLEFADHVGGPTGVKTYLKYMEYLDPSVVKGETSGGMNLTEVIEKLREFGDVKEVTKLYKKIIDHPNDYLNLPSSIVQNLFEYIDLLIETPPRDDVFEGVIARAIIDYPDQLGRLYIKLTDFFKKQNNIEKVRHYYNKGISECVTLQDFVLIYDSYLEFEEGQLVKLTEKDPEAEILPAYMDEFESLIDGRRMLINDTLLRQNINNLDAWFARFELVKGDLNKLIKTLTEAIQSINPLKVTTVKDHKLSEIWGRYIEIYASRQDYKTANLIYSKAVLSQYEHPDELADLYINWCEMLLGCDEFPETQPVEILKEVLEKHYDETNRSVQNKLIKSKKLQEFYNDLVESFKM
ncbi:Pre-mRNA-splicing factor SYF1 [Candida viswanathii]|uniref:Pre-mRNA-splicing factor SYF1 n=1 Tax=Candida viswanathii TaxID=5486 RepID=A0A367XQQ9_9ASCO|nr:Pre-mRNA-splicing factor SYF1 [Candida viswanathii]